MFNTNNKTVTALLLATLLTACGSDDKKIPSDIPTIPEGYGDNNDPAVVAQIKGTWSQDCTSVQGNIAKRQQITFGDKSITVVALEYGDSSCTTLHTRDTYIGQYQLNGPATIGNDEVNTFEVIYTQSFSSVHTQKFADARNKAKICDLTNWQPGVAVDVSDLSKCLPLFSLVQRKQLKFVRHETDRATQRPILFLDNPSKGFQPNGYPRELDISFLTPGEL
ncbi:hypothetical protein [Bacterioplanoides sp.]|uniref:hypothetical protein n=1 Tax=Bacterioplanoides sp. TaxID=2066072 RepID=UPI003B5A0410